MREINSSFRFTSSTRTIFSTGLSRKQSLEWQKTEYMLTSKPQGKCLVSQMADESRWMFGSRYGKPQAKMRLCGRVPAREIKTHLPLRFSLFLFFSLSSLQCYHRPSIESRYERSVFVQVPRGLFACSGDLRLNCICLETLVIQLEDNKIFSICYIHTHNIHTYGDRTKSSDTHTAAARAA